MGHSKRFRAMPVQLGRVYRRKQRAEAWRGALNYLGVSLLGGVELSADSLVWTLTGAATWQAALPLAVQLSLVRQRLLQEAVASH